MKLLFFGSSSFAIPSLEAITSSRHELPAVFTQPARPTGRGKKLKPTDVAEWANKKNITVIEAPNINKPDMLEKIRSYNADLLVVIAFGQKISSEVINAFTKRAINVHASLLPEYRGAAPVNHAIMDGKTNTGITIITLAEKMDAGDILATKETQIEPYDNAGSMHDKLANLAAPVLIDTINKIEKDTAKYTPQKHDEATLAPKLSKKDGYIDFDQPADLVLNKIRGLYPWPGAQAVFVSSQTGKSWKVTICDAQLVNSDISDWNTTGVIDEDLNVVCKKDKLKINFIKPAGSKKMDFKSFLNGRKGKPGDIFLPINRIKI
jgi:methionyl-tRNA formyltransferase